MGRLELRIPLTEVVVVEEDLRCGVMRIIVEGEEYPSWHVGDEIMAVRVDHGSSILRIWPQMRERMPEDRVTLADLREDSEEALAAMPATVSNKELETVVAIGSMAAVQSFLDHIRREQRFSKPFAKHLFPDLGKTVAQSMQTEFNAQRWILKPQTTYIKHYLASRMIRPQIGLTARQSAAVNRRYFKMLEDGIRPDVARSRALRYHNHLLKYRADTIARTELISAQNHGKLEGWNQASDKGLFDKPTSVKEWSAAADACDECLDLDGERVRLDEPFSAGVMSPTLHPCCRCSMNLIQNAEPT